MGMVYKARGTHRDRFVAIKVLPPEKVADAEHKRRFVQEAKSASALNHPNIIMCNALPHHPRGGKIIEPNSLIFRPIGYPSYDRGRTDPYHPTNASAFLARREASSLGLPNGDAPEGCLTAPCFRVHVSQKCVLVPLRSGLPGTESCVGPSFAVGREIPILAGHR